MPLKVCHHVLVIALKFPNAGDTPLQRHALASPQCLTCTESHMMFASLEENVPHVQQMVTVNASPLRSYFPFGGVLITRTAADAQPPVAALGAKCRCDKGGVFPPSTSF